MMIRNVEARNILQGLFDKWNGKSEEVVNEAKVEDVQTTINIAPPNLYSLNFVHYGANVYHAYFGDILIGKCYPKEREDMNNYFNYLKNQQTPIPIIQEKMKGKYLQGIGVSKTKPKKSKRKKGRGKGNFSKDKYVFRPEKNGRFLLCYRFNKKLEPVCRCGENDKESVLHELEDLLDEGYSKTHIKYLLKSKYDGRKTRWQNQDNKLSINPSYKVEAPIIPLSNYSWNDRGFLLKGAVNTHIVPADFNDIESVLANNGSTRSVTSLLPNCDYEALMDLSKYCKTEEYANLRREGIMIMNNR